MPTAPPNDRPALRKQFAADMVELGIWYAHHLQQTQRIARHQLVDALTRRVNIYRLTTLWDGSQDPGNGCSDPRWHSLATEICSWLLELPFEQATTRAMQRLAPLLRTERDKLSPPTFGCWHYHVVGEGIADRPGLLGRATNPRKLWHKARRVLGSPAPNRHAELHFSNALLPRSPFEQPHELLRSLADLVADCRIRHPAVARIWCSSWLNDREDFVALFPPSWRSSAVARSPEAVDAASLGRACLNTDNWWGQFQRRDGSFHAELAQQFRTTGGVWPFTSRTCNVAIRELATHLESRLSPAGSRC